MNHRGGMGGGQKPESRWIKEIVRCKRRSKEKIASVVDCWIPNALYYANSLSILLKYPFYFAFATWHTIRRSFNSCVLVCVYESQAVCLRKSFFHFHSEWQWIHSVRKPKTMWIFHKVEQQKIGQIVIWTTVTVSWLFLEIRKHVGFFLIQSNTLARYDFCIALYRPTLVCLWANTQIRFQMVFILSPDFVNMECTKRFVLLPNLAGFSCNV